MEILFFHLMRVLPTEEVQEQTPIVAQVEDEEVAIASETNISLSNSNGQIGVTASDEGSSKGLNFILFASYFYSFFFCLHGKIY